MQQKFDLLASEPLESFPNILSDIARALAVRLGSAAPVPETEPLVDAKVLAQHLGTPESWVRGEQRAGRIPYLKLGRYIRFKIREVEAALAARPKQ